MSQVTTTRTDPDWGFDKRLFREASYVNGEWCTNAAGKEREVCNPATGERLGAVPALSPDEARCAIDAAEDAFQEWRALLPQERSRYLRDWYDAMVAVKEDLATIMTLEQGKPLAEAQGEIDYAASFIEWYAEEARRVNAESVTPHLPGTDMIVRREPVGVAALVIPWNFPTAMLTRKAGASLAAGCTVVVHPSTETPFSALALAELANRVGLPAGVFNVVTGRGSEVVTEFCKDPRVRALSFTGSTEVGRVLAHGCSNTVKVLIMELGGHAPFIVFPDVDLDKAVECAISAKFTTTGQDCLAANRFFVHGDVFERFAAAFTERTEALKIGNGFEPGVEIGPLMNEPAVAKCEEHVVDALNRGAKLLCGGKRHDAGPLFFEPTVLSQVPEDSLIFKEETFGPVAPLVAFEDEDDVLKRANATEYGLAAYLHTRDYARITRVSKALEYGMVAVNRTKMTGPPIPFGGVKQSGLGREGSRHGLEAFTVLKYVCVDVD